MSGENGNTARGGDRGDKDWGRIIYRIVLLVFIVVVFIVRFSRMIGGNVPVPDAGAGTETVSEATTETASEASKEGAGTETASEAATETTSEITTEAVSETSTTESDEEVVSESPATEEDGATPAGDVTEAQSPQSETAPSYRFRSRKLLNSHYEKHGIEMGFDSAEEYEAAAAAVAVNPDALHKLEQEDGDDVYYLEDTGEFVIISTDGFIRTYYYASKSYFDRQ